MGGDAKVFTFEDVTVHNKPKDCWLIINGKVYDVTKCSWKITPDGDEARTPTDDFEDVGP
ncbi:hypothetical protein NC651_003166 [Populus alba x Populus x berolinensis]|nr:hypothetical protein NC651_003166 [Populus alba x Populus x berolinensis]